MDIYFSAVGGNSNLLLNLPPDRRGLIHETDVARLKELGKVIRHTFQTNLALGAQVSASSTQAGIPLIAAEHIGTARMKPIGRLKRRSSRPNW